MNLKVHRKNFYIDLFIILCSIIAAVVLAKSGALEAALVKTLEWKFVGSFVAGIAFSSIFTAAPATVILGKIAQADSVWLVALLGGAGAMFGDYIIFKFTRDRLADDVFYFLKRSRREKIALALMPKFYRRLLSILGAIIIISPLPDELGLLLMGLSKTKTKWFFPLSFVLNFIGILIIGFTAKAL